jgi:hypothetical protein
MLLIPPVVFDETIQSETVGELTEQISEKYAREKRARPALESNRSCQRATPLGKGKTSPHNSGGDEGPCKHVT